MLTIKFARMHVDAKEPTKRKEDAGYDLYPCFDGAYIKIPVNETVIIPTKIRVKIPDGYYMQFLERGSTGIRGIGQRAGVIDSGYTGELLVPITNHSTRDLYIMKEDCSLDRENVYTYEKAICQMVLLPVPDSRFAEISQTEMDFIETVRRSGKFGSSGK